VVTSFKNRKFWTHLPAGRQGSTQITKRLRKNIKIEKLQTNNEYKKDQEF